MAYAGALPANGRRTLGWIAEALRLGRQPGDVLSIARSPSGGPTRVEYLVRPGWRGDVDALAISLAARYDAGDGVWVDVYRGDLARDLVRGLQRVASSERGLEVAVAEPLSA
jgi:hypothetical protein